MALTLYLHPLASFCHKVLIALYENAVQFRPVIVDLGDPSSAAAVLARWPAGKIPVLHDAARGRSVPETSIIIDYLQAYYPGPVALLPAETEARLEARLWDRFFDLHVGVPMQKIVTDRLRPEGGNDAIGVADAHRSLDIAYAMLDDQLAGRDWAAGADFTIADCAAAPSLFFAAIVHPFAPEQRHLAGYFERLLGRPSVRRTLREARPYFSLFPYREAMPERFLHD
ncbi:glutathione S-transferase family protein [Labrys neptuniae]